MSESERSRRPGTQPEVEHPEKDDPKIAGGSVEGDRAWAQERIAGFFRGQRVMRSAKAGAEQAGGEVSQPHEPAEKEADAVADQVAGQLHGEAVGEHGHAPKETPHAPISAKLDGGTVSLAKKTAAAEPAWVTLSVSGARKTHILTGDASGGGHAHRATVAGKTKFPESWTDDKIITAIETVANNAANYPNGKYPQAKGPKSRYIAEATIDGVAIKVVVEPKGEGIITGHPK